jgi:hypothetical protein
MRRKLILSFVVLVVSAGESQAANLAVITSPPTIMNILVLFFAGGCLALCFQLLSLVRGGLFGKIWQWFTIGFALLALSQIAALLSVFEVVAMPGFMVPALLVLMAGIFLYGILEAKRVLS